MLAQIDEVKPCGWQNVSLSIRNWSESIPTQDVACYESLNSGLRGGQKKKTVEKVCKMQIISADARLSHRHLLHFLGPDNQHLRHLLHFLRPLLLAGLGLPNLQLVPRGN